VAAAVALVEAGLGAALVPESLAAMRIGTITYRHLLDVDEVSEIALVTMTHRSRVTRNFVRSAIAVSKL